MSVSSQAKRPGINLGSVRFRLIAMIVAAVLLPVLITQTASIITTRNELIQEAEYNLQSLAEAEADVVSSELANTAGSLHLLAGNRLLEETAEQQNAAYEGSEAEILTQIQALDEQWRTASPESPLVQGVLSHEAVAGLLEFQQLVPGHVEVFFTDKYGALVASSGLTSDYYQADEDWWQRAWAAAGEVVFSEPEFDESAQAFAVNMAVVIDSDITGEPVGVLRSTLDLNAVGEILKAEVAGETGHTLLLSHDTQLLAGPQLTEGDVYLTHLAELVEAHNPVADGQLTIIADETGTDAAAFVATVGTGGLHPEVDELDWHIVLFQAEEEILGPITSSTNTVLTLAIGVALAGVVAAVLLSRTFTQPLLTLTNYAGELGQTQDWSLRIPSERRDEFGTLSRAFNNMAAQLEDLISGLEERISARTQDLRTVADVSVQIATILDVQRLLQDIVDLTKERFRLYHAHIYIKEPDSNLLELTAGAGHVGRQMVSENRVIDLYNPQSIVARAARERESIPVQDVTASETFLPHPLLPDTTSEFAMPLMARGQVLGVLDVQSDQKNYFTPEVIDILELLATQIGVAFSNARLFEAVERTSRHEAAMSTITRHIQEAIDMDDILQVTVRELGKALRVPYTAIELKIEEEPNGSHPVSEGVSEGVDETAEYE